MGSLIVFIALFGGGFFFGRRNEKKHVLSLQRREAQYAKLPHRSTGKKESFGEARASAAFYESVVMGQDYFKMVVFSLVNLFGGRIVGYEALLDRGRREALLRVKEKARSWGASELVNIRFETSNIGGSEQGNRKGSQGTLEVMVYGTGIKY